MYYTMTSRNTKHNPAQDVIRDSLLQLRMEAGELKRITAFCESRGYPRAAWCRSVLRLAVIKAEAYSVTVLHLDANDVRVMEQTKGQKQ
jgi:hypothetical protein